MEDEGAGEAPPVPPRSTKLPTPRDPGFPPSRDIEEAFFRIFRHDGHREKADAKINEAPAADDENQRDRDFMRDGLWRWDKRGDLEEKGIMDGSDGFITKDGYVQALNNATYGDKTIYLSGSRDGSRGFIESEMLANYLAEENEPKESERWHLYKVYPTPEIMESLIDLSEFRKPERLAPFKTNKDYIVEMDRLRQPEFDELLELVPQLTREQQGKLKKYLDPPNASNRLYHKRDEKILAPVIYVPEPSEGVLSTPRDRIAELNYQDADRLGTYLIHKAGTMISALHIAQQNAQTTDEVQLRAPIPKELVVHHGSVEFKPEHWRAFRDDVEETETISVPYGAKVNAYDFSKGNAKARRNEYVPATEKLSREIAEVLDEADKEIEF